MKIQSKLCVKDTIGTKKNIFITIYFINHIFHLPLASFDDSVFLSYRDAILISRIVIRRMQGFRMSSKGLSMFCWLNTCS